MNVFKNQEGLDESNSSTSSKFHKIDRILAEFNQQEL